MNTDNPYGFTPAELDCVKYLPEGFTNERIAKALNITTHTVKAHLHSVYGKYLSVTKIQAKNRLEARIKVAIWAQDVGLTIQDIYAKENRAAQAGFWVCSRCKEIQKGSQGRRFLCATCKTNQAPSKAQQRRDPNQQWACRHCGEMQPGPQGKRYSCDGCTKHNLNKGRAVIEKSPIQKEQTLKKELGYKIANCQQCGGKFVPNARSLTHCHFCLFPNRRTAYMSYETKHIRD